MKKDIFNYLNGSLINICNYYKEKTQKDILILNQEKNNLENFLKPKQIEELNYCINIFEKMEHSINIYDYDFSGKDFREGFNAMAVQINDVLYETSSKICSYNRICSGRAILKS